MSVFSSDVIGRIVICGNALAARLLLHPNTRNKPTFQIYQTTMGGLDRMLKKTMKNYRWHNQEKRALCTVNMNCLSKLWNLTHLLKTLLAAKFTSIPVHVGSVKIGDFQRPPGWGRCGSGWTGSTRGRPSSTSPPPTVNSGWRWHRLPQPVILYICVVISSIDYLQCIANFPMQRLDVTLSSFFHQHHRCPAIHPLISSIIVKFYLTLTLL